MMVALGDFLFRFRTTLSPLLLLLLLVPGPAVFEDPFIAAGVGIGVAALGQVVRATTIGLRYIVRGGRNHRVYADDLVTEGLFHHVRNPMYVGKFLMVLGAGIAANRWPATVGICAAYAFMYHAVVLAEEAYLRGKFGAAFDDYCRRVPRWVPRLRALGETLTGSEFAWRRVLAKEYSAPLGWSLPIVAIGLYNLNRSGRLDDSPYRIAFLCAVLIAAVALWIVAGWLKKGRQLAGRAAGG
jgi:protein-S-isoprenylcysteine O-methyltransferase Ste14